MCGIFGIITAPQDTVNVGILEDSMKLLQHRGPDSGDCYSHKNIGLAHRRLSIFDTSEAGKQPMHFEYLSIVFNGAIYNFPELKQKLSNKGYNFKTQTDTEVILMAYHCWGEDCVHRFKGQWAFIIYDNRKHQLFCSRDRFGIKPLYYTWTTTSISLASEIKAFSVLPDWKAKLNQVRAVEYLAYQMHDHTEETFFNNVFLLKKGHHLIIDTRTLRFTEKQYYNLDQIQTQKIALREASIQFNSIFEKSISIRLRSDVPVGTALSGGLDSSSIALIIDQKNQNPFSTYSAVYEQKAINEKPYLDAVLNKGDFVSHIINPSIEYYNRKLDTLLWHQEEPFNGFGVFAQFCIFEAAAKDGIKVMLDGQGADEILGGYEKFLWYYLKSNRQNPWKLFQNGWHIYTKNRFPLKSVFHQLKQYKRKNRTASLPSWIKADIPANRFFKRPAEDSMSAVSKNLINHLGLGALLRYEDKNAMAHGIESRVPFLDHELVEFCLSLPDELKIKNGTRKYILRESQKRRLPSSLYHRHHKLGFATPQKTWLDTLHGQLLQNIQTHYDRLDSLISRDFHKLDPLTLWRIDLLRRWIEKFDIDLS